MGSAFDVGKTELYFSIDSAWTEEGRVKGTRSICSKHNFDVSTGVKPVELGDEFKHGSLNFIVSTCAVIEPGSTDGIDFIKKDDAGFLRASHFEQLPDHPCTFANVPTCQTRCS
jgi:hypothetical protein